MKYPFYVYQTQIGEHVFWVAESPHLRGCVGQGDTMDDAIRELENNETVWLETAVEFGFSIPQIPVEPTKEYSGKFTVRVSPSAHKMAALYAQKENISLNQYVNDAIVSQNSRYETADYMRAYFKEVVGDFKMLLFNSTPTFSNGETVASFNKPLAGFTGIGVATSSRNSMRAFSA